MPACSLDHDKTEERTLHLRQSHAATCVLGLMQNAMARFNAACWTAWLVLFSWHVIRRPAPPPPTHSSVPCPKPYFSSCNTHKCNKCLHLQVCKQGDASRLPEKDVHRWASHGQPLLDRHTPSRLMLVAQVSLVFVVVKGASRIRSAHWVSI